jgi:tetratricopeptide (TPR) repeat protein
MIGIVPQRRISERSTSAVSSTRFAWFTKSTRAMVGTMFARFVCGLTLCACICDGFEVRPARLSEAVPGETSIRELLAEDRWVEALDRVTRLHRAAPADLGYTALLGQALFRAARFDEVDRLLTPLAEATNAPPLALLTLARLRHAQGRFGESAGLLQRAIERAPEDRELLYWAADIAPRRGQAIDLLERYLERSAGDDADRIEDARGTLGVLKELGQRQVWVPLEHPERLQLPLRHIWDETGATIGYVVEARVGEKGKTARLLLDTGNPGLYLVHRVARRGGFIPLGQATTYGGAGDRRHRVGRGMFAEFALGELRYGDALVTSTREELDATGRFHGLLGLSAFGGYRVTLDLVKKRLLLERGSPALEGSPYWVVSGQILVVAQTEQGPPGLFLFDTGASRSLLSTSYVERLPDASTGAPTGVEGPGGAYRGAVQVPGVRMRYQGLTGTPGLAAVDMTVRSKMSGVEISGYLGLEFLDQRRIVIDSTSRTLRVRGPTGRRQSRP